MLPWRRALLLVLAVAVLLNLGYVARRPGVRARISGLWSSDVVAGELDYERTLGIASDIFVANLPRRSDRRANMTTLAERIGARFTFVDAVDMYSATIQNIMNHVRVLREEAAASGTVFAWPTPGAPVAPLDWTGPLPAGVRVDNYSLTCNRGDWTPVPREDAAPWEWQSEGRIACWETHLRIIRTIAAGRGSGWWSTGRQMPISPADVAIILEDDVDIETDIRERLIGLWPSLPKAWDMIFFGWCWASEGKNEAIGHFAPPGTNQTNSLRPSDAPQCTHAYALSIPGARRLLAHLEYPAFAYSRAIDQAYVHLIQTGRITAFSVDPAIVIQRKMDKSDIGEGATWGESLYNPALGS